MSDSDTLSMMSAAETPRNDLMAFESATAQDDIGRDGLADVGHKDQERSIQVSTKSGKAKLSRWPQARFRHDGGTVNRRQIKRERKQQIYLRNLRGYQLSRKLSIPKIKFQILCREIGQDFMSGLKWQVSATGALQEFAEAFLVSVFQEMKIHAQDVDRETVYSRDMKSVFKGRFGEECAEMSLAEAVVFNIVKYHATI